ncbi:MAG: DNA polymerase I [Salibacteraceae bacterium]
MPEPSKKLFLLDAYALIYRAYFAFIKNPRINSKGLNTSAVFGFTNTLLEVINKQQPTHIAVVFDPPQEKTFRHEEYAEYKAQREAMPEDLRQSIPYIQRLIEGFNIPGLMVMGFEADDVIGTLAHKARNAGFETYMMTPDKDYGQLVGDNVYMFKPARMGNGAEVWGAPEVCAKFEIEQPEQVIDILGLWGDAVDNIPGVPGVGEKTAKKLIGQYGSIENLLENTHELKGKLKERVEANKEQALLSKRLATIVTDVPIEFDEQSMLIEKPNEDALKELFAELEFRNLARKVLGEDAVAPAPAAGDQMDLFSAGAAGQAPVDESPMANLETSKHEYHLADTPEKRVALLQQLQSESSYCFDTETTGLDPRTAELVGIAFSWKTGTGWYVPVPADQAAATAIAQEFKGVLEDSNKEKIGQNLKYDITVLERYGIQVSGPLFDTMLAHYLIQPDMNRRNMDLLAKTYLHYEPVSIEKLIGKKGKNQKSMRDVPVEEVVSYACEDADITLQLKEKFDPKLDETETRKLFNDLETPLIPVLTAMEGEGIRLNKETMSSFSEELQGELADIQKNIYEEAGTEFNIASPKQVGEVLFDHLKVTDKPKKTKTGQYSTSEDVLSQLRNNHPIVGKILEFREVTKLKNTYVDVLPKLINPATGRIHTTYNQVVAATGRLSSDHPNLQNIPIRTKRGREIRKAFVPRDDNHVLLSADYSQIELRIIAELSGDEGMKTAFAEGVDIHSATAAKVYGVGLEEVDREMRSKAKAVNFGLAYGQGVFGLSQTLGIPRKEAKEIIDSYFDQFSSIKQFMETAVEKARKTGYSITLMGRKRFLRDINSGNHTVRSGAERLAVNSPIQGTAADMIKQAMIMVHRRMEKEGFRSRMLLQVHDELVFDAHKDEVDDLKPLVIDLMQNALPLSIPIVVEAGVGNNWLEAH